MRHRSLLALLTLLEALVAASAGAWAQGPGVGGPQAAQLTPEEVYWTRAPDGGSGSAGSGLLVIAPNTALLGSPLPAAEQPPRPTPQPEACGAACLAQGAACGWFAQCGAQVSGSSRGGQGGVRKCGVAAKRTGSDRFHFSRSPLSCPRPLLPLGYRRAVTTATVRRSHSRNAAFSHATAACSRRCTRAAGPRSAWQVRGVAWEAADLPGSTWQRTHWYARAPPDVTVLRYVLQSRPRHLAVPPPPPLLPLPRAGFPARRVPQLISGFTESPGQGILGADLECPHTEIAGACAVNSSLDAASLCIEFLNCRAITVLLNGGWVGGCAGG